MVRIPGLSGDWTTTRTTCPFCYDPERRVKWPLYAKGEPPNVVWACMNEDCPVHGREVTERELMEQREKLKFCPSCGRPLLEDPTGSNNYRCTNRGCKISLSGALPYEVLLTLPEAIEGMRRALRGVGKPAAERAPGELTEEEGKWIVDWVVRMRGTGAGPKQIMDTVMGSPEVAELIRRDRGNREFIRVIVTTTLQTVAKPRRRIAATPPGVREARRGVPGGRACPYCDSKLRIVRERRGLRLGRKIFYKCENPKCPLSTEKWLTWKKFEKRAAELVKAKGKWVRVEGERVVRGRRFVGRELEEAGPTGRGLKRKLPQKCPWPKCGYEITVVPPIHEGRDTAGNLFHYFTCPSCGEAVSVDEEGNFHKENLEKKLYRKMHGAREKMGEELEPIDKELGRLAETETKRGYLTAAESRRMAELEKQKKDIEDKFKEEWEFKEKAHKARASVLKRLGLSEEDVKDIEAASDIKDVEDIILKRKGKSGLLRYFEGMHAKEAGIAKELKLKEEKQKEIAERYKEKREGVKKFKAAEIPAWFERWPVTKAFGMIFLLAAGAVISGFLGSWMFFLAFLSWGLFYMLPSPTPPEIKEKVVISLKPSELKNFFGKKYWGKSASYALWGTLRSFMKAATLVFFIIGIQTGQVPFQNLAMILIAFIGYYSLKIQFDPDQPAEVIESVIRFGIGVYVIPYMVFYQAFGSLALAAIAFAFFAIPPMANREKKSEVEVFAMSAFFDKMLFALIMGATLAGVLGLFGAGWELTGALQATFIYFWVVCFIAGFFSTASTRPTTGFLMLGAATIIFGLGPGTQEFGQALLGQWFPAVYKGVSTTFEPLTDAFGQMTGTLGTAFQLLVNPMGFAQRIMNGTYTTDPATGLKGAFGLEIEEFRTTPIYIGQPYSAIVKLKNKGAFEAEKVVVAILPGEKSPKEKIPSLKLYPGDVLKDMRARILVEQAEKVGQEEAVKQLEGLKLFHIPEGLKFSGGIDLAGLGFSTEGACYGGTACWQFVGDVVKLDVRQLFFESKGVSCASLVRYDLHKQFLPLRTIVQYDYGIHSSLAIEFISTGEWDRLVAEELLITQQKKPASLDNAPVRLNIDTLEQPIREGTPLFLGLELTPVKGEVLDPVIQLDVPAELNLDYKNCLPQEVTRKEGDSIIFNFTGKDPPYLVYCPLPPMTGMTEATQTLTVRANADYTFVKTKHTAEKVEFGAIQCCKEDKDCLYAPAGQKCDKTTNICGKVVEVPAVGLGSSKYCEDVRKGSCQLGEGNCKAGECDTQPKYPYKTAADSRGLECRDTNTAGLKVCCWQGATPQECQKAFKLRQDGKERSDLNKEMWGI